MSKLDCIRRYNEKRKKAGLCLACNEPAKEGSVFCEGHLEKRRIRNKKNSQNKKFKYQKGDNYV